MWHLFFISLIFHHRAQKLDGAFFEGFVDIKDKQKEHVEEAAKGSLKREVQSSYAFHSTTANTIFTPPPKEKVVIIRKLAIIGSEEGCL